MKVAIKQRRWRQNMGLVFRLVRHNFVPLFLISILLRLPPVLSEFLGQRVGPILPLEVHFLEIAARISRGDYLIWELLLVPLKQGLCIYVIASCYKGVRMPLDKRIGTVVESMPWLVLYFVLTTALLFLAILPGGFVVTAMRPAPLDEASVALIVIGLPLLWMLSGLVLGPSSIILDRKRTLSAYRESMDLAKGNRLYLLSFLGLLFLLFALGPILAAQVWPRSPPPRSFNPLLPHGEISMSLIGVQILLRSLLDLPLMTAPVVLYLDFTAKPHGIADDQAARLVDQISNRYDDVGD